MSSSHEKPSPGRVEILAAAAKAFAEHGYHGMSMRDLAKATNRSPATLYNYVDSKEDLLYLIQRDAFEELVASARAALEGVPESTQRLRLFVDGHVRFFADRPHLMRVLIHEAAALPPARRTEVRERKEAYFRIARDVLQSVMRERSDAEPDPVEIERNTYCLFGMLNWTYGWYEPERHGTAEDLARTIEHAALAGLVVPAAHSGTQPLSERRPERSRAPHESGARSGGAR